MTSEEYFRRQVSRLYRSLYQASLRNDYAAIEGLRNKIHHYEKALKALEEVHNENRYHQS